MFPARLLGPVALFVLVAAAALGAEGPPRRPVLRVAYAAPASSPIHAGAAHFEAAFEQAAAGRAEVRLLPGAGEGNDAAVLAQLRRGAVEVAILGGEGPPSAAARVTGLPLLFRDVGHRRRVVEGEAAQLLARRIAEQSSLTVWAFFAGPEEVLATADGPVARPEELRGMPFRVAGRPMLLEGLRGLGVAPMPLPLPLLPSAVRRRMVLAAHVDLQTALDLELDEVFPYMSDPATPFLAELLPVVADRKVVAALPSDLQRALGEAMQAGARRTMDLAAEATARARDELEDRGVQFTSLDRTAFAEAVRPLWEAMGRLWKAEDVVARIRRSP